MSTLVNNTSGNFTSSTTWGVIDTTSFVDSETGSTASTLSFISSQSFTPGAITIDAIALKILSRSSSPSGTFTVRLAIGGVAVSGTTVTINVSDLQVSQNGWAVFRLAAPVTLLAATAYTIQITSSVNAQVTCFRTATAGDWSRFLRTTTQQAPAASDTLFICGEYTGVGTSNTLTVTMDNTSSTIFGKIETSGKGILTCGTASSTSYQLITGGAASSFYINGDGIVQWGTSLSPIPATSSMLHKINQNGVAVTNGIILRGNGNFTTFGASKTQKAFFAADASVSATTITTDISTGWKSGDLIGLASTTRTSTQTETVTLTSNATGTTVPVTALSFTHSGTGETKGEIANLTRNVKIQGETTSLTAYILTNTSGTFNVNNTEVYFMGSTTTNKRGVDVLTDSTGSFFVDGCVWRDFTNGTNFGFLLNSSSNANITISNTNLYNITSVGLAVNSTLMTAPVVVNNILAMLAAVSFNGQGNVVSNITAVSTTFSIGNIAVLPTYRMTDIVVHSSSAAGISISSNSLNTLNISNVNVWRNTTRGIFFSIASNIQITNGTIFGNGTSGLEVSTTSLLYLNNIVFNGGTTLVQPIGLTNTASSSQVFLDTCTFGVTTTHSTSDINVGTLRSYHEVYLTNCLLNSSTEVSNQSNLVAYGIIGSTKHDQTIRTHKAWKRVGIISSDVVIAYSSPISQRITPSSSSSKCISGTKLFSIPSGKTAKIIVGVRRSVVGDGTAYNGSFPRLWLRSNNSAGISSDILLATATSASSGAFEYLIGTIPTANDNTINSLFIDLDGTTGWINIDSWKLEIIDGSANAINVNSEDYWNDGASYGGINTLIQNNSGNESYWLNGTTSQEIYPVGAVETGKYFLLF